jgi:hypothetical protein
MSTSIDTQTGQLLAHLRRGGNYSYIWAASQQKNENNDPLWKATTWCNGAGPSETPDDQHAQYGPVHLYFGVHPTKILPKERMRDGKLKPIHPGNARAIIEEIAAVNCLFGEFDAKDFGGSKEAAWAHIEGLPALPSVIIDSGGGYHCYWLLDEPYLLTTDQERQHAKDVQARWVAFVQSDDDSKDLARVLRIPGTLNYKYDPARPITFVSFDLSRLYTLDTLEGELPPVEPRQEKRDRANLLDLTGNVQRARHALARLSKKRCDQYNSWIAVGQALAELGNTGRELWIEWSKSSEKFDEDVCIAKWATFRADPKGLTLGSLFYWANEDDPNGTADPRPAIDISTIDLPIVMPQAWDAIVAANDPPLLFRRAGELVRLERTENGALLIKTVDTRRMAGILARAARWVRISYDKRGGTAEKETIPPVALVDDGMVNVDARIPALTRIVHAPAFADGETLLTTPGYHPEARIYYDPAHGVVVPDVPSEPTPEHLERARALILEELLCDFPFVSDADRAHAVALFLLPFVRELINGPTPLHLIEAPTMGTGKGLLAETLMIAALGDTPSPMTEATTDEEWGKSITSNLLAAPAVIYIDNLNRMLASGKLAAALTAREFSDRVLGKSEQVALPVRCVWMATANNPTLSTEISRRCIRIRIDPRVDEPWKREGFKHPKLRSWVEANRADLIWSALVLCRYGLAHGTAGRPLGSYEAWSDVIGCILNGCNIPGFLDNLDLLYARADAEGAAWRALIAAWWEKHQSLPMPASELFPLVAEVEADLLVNGRDEVGRKKSFGKALARVLDRVFSAETTSGPLRLQITEDGVRHKAKLWKLAPVEQGGIGGLGGLSHPHARENISSALLTEKNTQNTHNPPALPAEALWHGGEYDQLVTVTGVLGEQDGVTYYAIAGSRTGVPAHEVDFFDEPMQEVLL